MKISETVETFGGSSKRKTTWNGMEVGFNIARTTFFVILTERRWTEHRFTGRRILFENEAERESFLETWRRGKAEWYSRTFGASDANGFIEFQGKAGLEIRRMES